MNNHTPVDEPWPKKKRVITSFGMTIVILLIAAVVGSGLYGLGRLVGIFQPKEEQIENEVIEMVLADEELVAKFMAALETQECVNSEMGFGLVVDNSLEPTVISAEHVCTEYSVVIDEVDYGLVKVTQQDVPKDEALNNYIDQMSQAYVEAFPHQQYEATLLRGDQESTPFFAVFYGTGEHTSWHIVYYPVHPIYEKAFFNVAKSFRLL